MPFQPTAAQQLWLVQAQQIEQLNRSDPSEGHRRAMAWLESAESGGSPEECARARRSLAGSLRYLGRYQEALEAFDRCRTELEQLRLSDEVIRTNLGHVAVLRYIGQYDRALLLTREAIEYFEATGDIAESAKHYINLGVLLRRTGELEHARQAYEVALTRARHVGDVDREAVANMNLGNVLSDLGELTRADDHLHRAIELYRSLDQKSYVAMALSNLGRLKSLRGEHGEAISALRESRRTYVRLKLPRDRAIIDLYLLRSYVALNLGSEARRAGRDAIRVLTEFEMPFELGQALLTMAGILSEAKSTRQAHQYARRAREVFAAAGVHVWEQVSAASVAILGTRLRHGLSLPDAVEEIRAAREDLLIRGAREWAGTLLTWEGSVLEQLQETGAAQQAYLSAREIGLEIGADELVYRSYWAEALLPDTTSDQRLTLLRHAAEYVERVRQRARVGELQSSFLGNKVSLFESALATLLEAPISDDAQVFEFAERAQARSMADAVTHLRAELPSASERERSLREQLVVLRARSNALYGKAYASSTSGAPEEGHHGQSMEQLESQIERTRQELFLLRPTVEHSPLARMEDLQGTLADGQAAVVYLEARGFVHALVLTRSTVQFIKGCAPVSVVRHHARRVRFHTGKAAYGSDYLHQRIDALREQINHPLRALGDLLLAPLLEAIADSNQLVVLPSTSTYGLPVHAFMLSERTYATDQLAVQYAPSATVRVVTRQRQVAHGGHALLVAIADPSLPGVLQEVDRVAAMLPGAVVLTDQHATIASFREHAQSASAVHLATHGVFREDNPAFSAIKFADGWMTAADLAEICRDTAMMTLSACETGMGVDQGGGEIMGISQAVLGAGCASLVSSLWTADDRGTVSLMTDFYRELARGATAPWAMQQAMQCARQRDDHPYFWAPFAVFGEGQLPTTCARTADLHMPHASAAPDLRKAG